MITRRGTYWYIGNPQSRFHFKRFKSPEGITVLKLGRCWLSWFPMFRPRFEAHIEPKHRKPKIVPPKVKL
jgi:hypothetical protein